jgi:hypothetical protein
MLRAEDDRRDHHLDEIHESRADGLQFDTHTGRDQAQHGARDRRDDHGDVEVMGVVSTARGVVRGLG